MCCTYGNFPISHSCEAWGTPTARLVRTPTCPKCACAPAALAGSQNRPNKIKQAEPVVGLGSIMLTFKLRIERSPLEFLMFKTKSLSS